MKQIHKTAIRYLRISSDRQSNYSIQGQDIRTLEWCQRNEVTIIDTFIDEGFSAKTFDRPDMGKLKLFIKEHYRTVDYLVVQELDRFSRDAGEAIVMIKKLQREYTIQIVGVNEGIIFDYSNPGSFFRAGLQLLLAEDDNIRRSSKVKAGIYTAKKNAGRYLGKTPFGYKKEKDEKGISMLVIDNDKAAVVEYIYNAFLLKLPLKQIAAEARSMGMKLRGKSCIARILQMPVYTSLLSLDAYKDNPAELVEAKHAPIINRTKWLEVQRKMKVGNSKLILSDEFPLRGVLNCHCGKPLTGAASTGRHGGHFNYYKCNQSKHLNISTKKAHSQLMEILKLMSLPQYIIEAIKERTLTDLEAIQRSNVLKIKQYANQLSSTEEKLRSVEEKWINNQMNFDTYQHWYNDLSTQRMALNAQLSKLKLDNNHTWELVNNELDKLSDLHHLYSICSTVNKQQLIRLGFDSKLYYQDQAYRTPYIMPLFSHNVLIMKEKGLLILDQQAPNLQESNLSAVYSPVIEPLTNFLLFIQQIKVA